MCDYSLENLDSREAKKGDLLTTTALGTHNTIGFVSADKPEQAVCLLHGSRLKVTGDVPANLAGELYISPGDMATFTQLKSADYRDGLIFDCHQDIQFISLQELLAGVTMEVMSIPVLAEVERPIAPTLERVLEPA